jgi:glycosyltransferase involved in cell wall biosynthesis
LKSLIFSVIVPTRNRKEILENTIILLESQTLDKSLFEVIIVDDGSEDGTDKYMQELSTPLSMKYLRHEFRGASYARNVGLKSAEGEFVIFLGDDVHPSENLLKTYYEQFHENEERVFIIGKTVWAKHLLKSRFIKYLEEQSHAQFRFNAIKDRKNVPPQYFNTANSAIPLKYILSCGLFDEDLTLYEDTELGMRLSRIGLKLVYVDSAIAYHNHHVTLSSYMKRQIIAGQNAYLCTLKELSNRKVYSFDDAFLFRGNPLTLPKKVVKGLIFNKLTIPLFLRYLKDDREQTGQKFLFNGILGYYHRIGVKDKFKWFMKLKKSRTHLGS